MPELITKINKRKHDNQPQKAFDQGIAGLMWFTVPNVACLVLFAFAASRVSDSFPAGCTMPQYIDQRFGKGPHLMYSATFLLLQVCSLGVQLIAGATILSSISGLSYMSGVLVLAAIFTSYSLIDGLRSSIRTDFLQMLIILAGIVLIVPAAIEAAPAGAIGKGLSGLSGKFGNPFDPHVAYTFGITVTIGLLSGPFGDQQHWQRVFAFEKGKAFKGYLLGALIFAIVPVSLGFLGFLGAGFPASAQGVISGAMSSQQVGIDVVTTLIPGWGLTVFAVMILAGLASTGDSALCTGSSIINVDIFAKYINPDADEKKRLLIARVSVCMLAALAAGIALIPGITILSLFLFYGTLRSSTFIPTLFAVFSKHVTARGILWGGAGAAVLGLPIYLTGVFTGNVHLKVAANIGIIAVSFIVPYLSVKKVK